MNQDLKQALEDLLRKPIEEKGYRLMSVDFGKEEAFVEHGKELALVVTIDKEGGVTAYECAEVSKMIEPILDKADLIKERYILEVSSPGVK